MRFPCITDENFKITFEFFIVIRNFYTVIHYRNKTNYNFSSRNFFYKKVTKKIVSYKAIPLKETARGLNENFMSQGFEQSNAIAQRLLFFSYFILRFAVKRTFRRIMLTFKTRNREKSEAINKFNTLQKRFSYNTSSLASGIYFIRVNKNEAQKTFKCVVVK